MVGRLVQNMYRYIFVVVAAAAVEFCVSHKVIGLETQSSFIPIINSDQKVKSYCRNY